LILIAVAILFEGALHLSRIDRDIWITANEMIKQFGEAAAVIAAHADAMP